MRQKRKGKHTVYVVHWPETNVVKAGYSERERWRAFLSRGGVVIDLVEFDDVSDAFAYEDVLHCALARRGPFAFESAMDARPYLGGAGGGYTECYRIPEGLTPYELFQTTEWMTL